MADSKMGPNLQAGAGFLAKRVQKSLNRAQEKVLQKLGKTMETKDEQFELCSQSLNKQQIDGNRLFKDVKAYHTAVKAVHETSKRLSQTLRDIYESDWDGVQDLAVITESEDLLWNDFEEKLSDQIVRTMENYTGQFPEVKERVAKRGRKLVDYDSARHHLEALQSAKKKDEAKISKAEEEFNKAQNVFEEINNELREELPVLYQSRIGCYVTVFQNISNLRDVFYKEMSVLNRELYNVMKKLETQHSGKAFIIKGLNSTSGKSKKRKSLVISNPIPCNTAFPADHVSIHHSTDNSKETAPSSPQQSQSISEETSLQEESGASSKDVNSSDSDLSSSGTNTPKRQSACDNESSDGSTGSHSPEEVEAAVKAEEAELATSHSDDSGVGVLKSEAGVQEVSNPPDCAGGDAPEQEDVSPPAEKTKPKAPPVPAPRVSFRATDKRAHLAAKEEEKKKAEEKAEEKEEDEKEEDEKEKEKKEDEKEEDEKEKEDDQKEKEEEEEEQEEREEMVADEEAADSGDESSSENPPDFLYKGVALESHAASEDGLLQFEEGDIILVLGGARQEEGLLRGIREESWNQHRDLQNHSGVFSEKLIHSIEAE